VVVSFIRFSPHQYVCGAALPHACLCGYDLASVSTHSQDSLGGRKSTSIPSGTTRAPRDVRLVRERWLPRQCSHPLLGSSMRQRCAQLVREPPRNERLGWVREVSHFFFDRRLGPPCPSLIIPAAATSAPVRRGVVCKVGYIILRENKERDDASESMACRLRLP